MVSTRVQTIVIGAGHAGLAMSYCLAARGLEHLVLERGAIAERWRSERWDSLTLLTPNWMTQLPGYHYVGAEPDGFDSRDRYRRYIEAYAQSFAAPVREHTEVRRLALHPSSAGYLLETNRGEFETANVVIATGPFHVPHIPACSAMVPDELFQVHTSGYRNPKQLPRGATLIVGAGNSGAQVAEELCRSGRKVYLSLGRFRRAPRRYRGRDLLGWLIDMGTLDRRTEDLPTPEAKEVPPPSLTGTLGGHDLDLHALARDGVVLLGRLKDFAGGSALFSQDIAATLASGDEDYAGFKRAIDEFVAMNGIAAPLDEAASMPVKPVVSDSGSPTALNLQAAGVTAIVWATGFKYDYSWVDLPLLNEAAEPAHHRGVTAFPGLHLIGLRWLTKYKSFFIYGVGEDAERLAGQIAARSG